MAGSELEIEQEYVTGLYERLDALRTEAAAREGDLWRAEVARLDAVADGLCFGRLDMRDGQRLYVGRLGLFPDDEDGEPLLVDWRAPVAEAFYVATAQKTHGVRKRRRITTRGRTVVALDDELLSGDEQDGLVGEAALLAAVTAERTGRMHDIVTTLRAEQDRIVRDDGRGVLVVQGGPGTGKTAVALHRVAYLLYTRAHLRNRGVLVLGPSRIFLDYIGQVLPGLGENTVVTATIEDLHPMPVTRVDPPEVAARKGSADMATVLARRIRVHLPEDNVDIDFEQHVLRVRPDDWRWAARRARRDGLPHNHARLVFQREIVAMLARRMVDDLEAVVLDETGAALDGGSADGRLSEADLRGLAAAGVVVDADDGPKHIVDETDRAGLRAALLANASVQGALDDVWPELTPEDLLDDTDRSAADIPLLDEAAALVGHGKPATFGHIVVDEAQELSDMAWRMLMRRCPSRSMTIVGDVAQTGSAAGADDWAPVLAPHVADRWRLAELTVNYRTPAEIMAATEDLLAAHHPGLRPPTSVRSTGEAPRRLPSTDLPATVAELVANHTGGTLAVIAPETLHDALGLARPPDLTKDTVLLTPTEAKGLEFDEVVIVDPATILAAPRGHNDLYVAMTRPTRRLWIVHPGPPPAELRRMTTS